MSIAILAHCNIGIKTSTKDTNVRHCEQEEGVAMRHILIASPLALFLRTFARRTDSLLTITSEADAETHCIELGGGRLSLPGPGILFGIQIPYFYSVNLEFNNFVFGLKHFYLGFIS